MNEAELSIIAEELSAHLFCMSASRSACDGISLPPLPMWPHVLLRRCSCLYSVMQGWLVSLLAADSCSVTCPRSPSSNVPSHMSTCCAQSKLCIGLWRLVCASPVTQTAQTAHTTHLMTINGSPSTQISLRILCESTVLICINIYYARLLCVIKPDDAAHCIASG